MVFTTNNLMKLPVYLNYFVKKQISWLHFRPISSAALPYTHNCN